MVAGQERRDEMQIWRECQSGEKNKCHKRYALFVALPFNVETSWDEKKKRKKKLVNFSGLFYIWLVCSVPYYHFNIFKDEMLNQATALIKLRIRRKLWPMIIFIFLLLLNYFYVFFSKKKKKLQSTKSFFFIQYSTFNYPLCTLFSFSHLAPFLTYSQKSFLCTNRRCEKGR